MPLFAPSLFLVAPTANIFTEYVRTKRAEPTANPASVAGPGGMSPVATWAIYAVRVCTSRRGSKCSAATEPAAIVTAIVSPTARASASKTAATIPERADGRTTLVAISQRVAPRPNAASFISLGTALIASSDIETIIGKIIAATTIIALAALKYVASMVLCIKGLITRRAKKP